MVGPGPGPAPALMKNRSAQAAYNLARPRRRTDTNCFCGQSGTALLFGMLSGYITLLCSGLQFVSSSMGVEGGGAGGQEQEQEQELHHNSNHSMQQDTHENMLPVLLVMSVATAFGFLGPLQDNPFHQPGRDLLVLSLCSLLVYGFLFWTYEVESLLGIFCCASIVSVGLHPMHALARLFCLPAVGGSSCNPCVWLYQLCFLRHTHLKADDDENERISAYQKLTQKETVFREDVDDGKLNV